MRTIHTENMKKAELIDLCFKRALEIKKLCSERNELLQRLSESKRQHSVMINAQILALEEMIRQLKQILNALKNGCTLTHSNRSVINSLLKCVQNHQKQLQEGAEK